MAGTVGGGVKGIAGAVGGGVKGVAGAVGGGVKGVAGSVAGGVGDIAGTVGGGVKGIAGTVGGGVKGIAGSVGSGVSVIGGHVDNHGKKFANMSMKIAKKVDFLKIIEEDAPMKKSMGALLADEEVFYQYHKYQTLILEQSYKEEKLDKVINAMKLKHIYSLMKGKKKLSKEKKDAKAKFIMSL